VDTPRHSVLVTATWWSRLVRPTTDLGVGVQVVSLLVLLGALWWLARRRPEWRPVVVGSGLVLLGFVALRAAH
jgi:hypothetical protein